METTKEQILAKIKANEADNVMLLKQLDELKSPSKKPTAEELLKSILLECVPKETENGIGWFIDDQWIFEQDWKRGRLWCYYFKVWQVFEVNYNMEYQQIEQLQINVVGKVLNCEDLIPELDVKTLTEKVGKVLNYKE